MQISKFSHSLLFPPEDTHSDFQGLLADPHINPDKLWPLTVMTLHCA